MAEVIVIGSGASAVHAAWPLVVAGHRVLMLDAGSRDEAYAPAIPAKPFREIRLTDPEQHRYFLGGDFEGIPLGPVRVGAQLTPPRQHVARIPDGLLPLESDGFHAMQSLALGGLGAAWGAGSFAFTDEEIGDWPIGRRDLQQHYDGVARRIGVCGSPDDDLAPHFGPSHFLLPPPRMDSNARHLYKRYKRRRQWYLDHGLAMGQPRLATATVEHAGRGPLRCRDMEFWADTDRAIYRPRYTVEELKKYGNFTYRAGCVAESFAERDARVHVAVHLLDGGGREEISADHLLVGAGTLGTARLVLRSAGAIGVKLPLASNPYTYYPCLLWRRLGRPTRDRRHSLTQLMGMYHSEEGSLLAAQVYSYRSLLTFKLVKESPLPTRESIQLMRLLQEYYVIVGIHHEDRPGPGKSLWLEGPGEGGRLRIEYQPTSAELERRQGDERQLMGLLRRLGCLPIKRIFPGEGSSIHYGGTLPMSLEEAPLTLRPDGSLRGFERVRIVDGSGFPSLPAKGLTLTLMANANRIGADLGERL